MSDNLSSKVAGMYGITQDDCIVMAYFADTSLHNKKGSSGFRVRTSSHKEVRVPLLCCRGG